MAFLVMIMHDREEPRRLVLGVNRCFLVVVYSWSC